MTSYFQALGKAVKSLTITLLRNAVLFIPGVMILNHFWKLDGVIAAQPVVETALAVICTAMYAMEVKSRRSSGHCLLYHEKASERIETTIYALCFYTEKRQLWENGQPCRTGTRHGSFPLPGI